MPSGIPGKVTITCLSCNKERKYHALGLCKPCYRRQYDQQHQKHHKNRKKNWRKGYKRNTSRLPKDRRMLIIDTYLAGSSITGTAKELGHSPTTVSRILEEAGISRPQSGYYSRKYAVNEKFFTCIDSEEKAYWLGFLAADGNVISNKISLELSVKDKGHIHKFRKALESEHPITVKDNVGSFSNGKSQLACIGINSKKMVQDLSHFGIIPNKTFIVTPPAPGLIPNHLLRHYWRGEFDGDGSIYSSKPKPSGKVNWGLELNGTKAMVQGFLDFILSRNIKTKSQPRPIENSYRVTFGGNFLAQQVVRLLYKGSSVCLNRKGKRASKLLSLPIKKSKPWSPGEDQVMKKYYPKASWEELLRRLPGRAKGQITTRAHKLELRRTIYHSPIGPCINCGKTEKLSIKSSLRGLCKTCWQREYHQKNKETIRQRRKYYGSLITCPRCGKEKHHYAKGLCRACYNREGKPLITCVRCGKKKPHQGKNMCSSCYFHEHNKNRRERKVAWNREWRKKNRDKTRRYNARARARREGLPLPPLN